MASLTLAPNRPALWFGLAVALQSVLLFAAPVQRTAVIMGGTAITLKTAPVDPYDPLRGYSVTLGYEISQPARMPGYPLDKPDSFSRPSSSDYTRLQTGDPVFVVLKKPTAGDSPWQPVRYTRVPPRELATDEVFLAGRSEGSRIRYGIETYYVPEERIDEVNRALAAHRTGSLVDLRVGGSGQAIPVQLRIAGKTYAF
jgi:uncharacterized membrane-anchored protein